MRAKKMKAIAQKNGVNKRQRTQINQSLLNSMYKINK